MKRTELIATCLLFALPALLAGSCSKASHDSELENALRELDLTMARQEKIAAAKESRIDSLRAQISRTEGLENTYALFDALFDEYLKWDTDSAFAYVHRKDSLAQLSGDLAIRNDAAYDLANRFHISGMYGEALKAMERIDTAFAARSEMLSRCRYLLYEIHHGLVQSTQDERARSVYRKREAAQLSRCRATITEDIIEYYNTQAKVLGAEGRNEEVIPIMERKLEDAECSLPERAMLHYWMADSYESLGDKRNALLHYAIGAKYDFLSPVKSYGSPIRATRLCYKMGDDERAYRYVMRNYVDSRQIGAQYRLSLIADMLPDVIGTYEANASRRNKVLTALVILMLLLSTGIGFALLMIRRGRNRLRDTVGIKDAYLAQFLSMFSEHIDSLERYRSGLRSSAKKMTYEQLQQELRSDEFINGEWEYLYDKFDKTFLGLYPDFVQQLNALLLPDRHIGTKIKDSHLTNELRVFALIRLGVTDSARIARFLRLGLSTVYNYRVKLRNAALGNRDDFEKRLMKIGM